MLILKRASKHRPGGPWGEDDYDVLDGEQHIGRIMRHPQAPKERREPKSYARKPGGY